MAHSELSTMWAIGTDTGGTFTDLVALSSGGEVRVLKAASTPPAFHVGVMNALRNAGIPAEAVRSFHHGTTIATNSLLTRNGARTALITTEGFRDGLELREGARGDLYDVNWDPPPPLIPRFDRLGVRERLDATGQVVVPLDDESLAAAAATLQARGVEAVAVCFLHAYANDAHEQRTRECLAEALPGAYVSISSEILPEPPEFPRLATTVANAYVGPVLRRYFGELETAVRAFGCDSGIMVMHSGGGIMTPTNARRVPIRTATSGPAAGVIAAAEVVKATDRRHAVSLDMGGTSTDIATIRDGEPGRAPGQVIEWGLPIGLPCIDLITIGAGGGSLAWIDSAGAPHVGPQSAGAVPGPACYGRGGTRPTTTDANLVLGRLRPDSLLGGEMTLEPSFAWDAIDRHYARPLGIDVVAAAQGILEIATDHMAHGIQRMTIQRGLDPRDFTLVAFGGAGPMHAFEIARQLELTDVVIPIYPGVMSALGLVSVDARHDLLRTYIAREGLISPRELEHLFTEMESEGRELLAAEGFAPHQMRFMRQIDFRYEMQVRGVTLPLQEEPLNDQALSALVVRFHDEYEREFKFAVRSLPVETRNLRVTAIGTVDKFRFPSIPTSATTDLHAAAVAEADVYFSDSNGFTPTTFYDRTLLYPGFVIEGPAVIEEYGATTVIPPLATAQVDDIGMLVLRPKR
jgi:N-methylhydantoinase A